MKCYNHPFKDAVGVCSICGKGLCAECAKTFDGKILCEKCYVLHKAVKPSKQYALIGAALGWLGSINIILIGAYTTMYCLHLAVIFRGRFQMEAYITGILTAVLTSTLAFGGYLMWRGHLRKGGILNLAAGIATILIYGYFTWSVPLLSPFGVAGPLLCAPALISGILGLISPRFFKK